MNCSRAGIGPGGIRCYSTKESRFLGAEAHRNNKNPKCSTNSAHARWRGAPPQSLVRRCVRLPAELPRKKSRRRGVPAAAVAFTDSCQVDRRLRRRPGIGSHRNLHTETAFAQSNAVGALGMQVVRDELVVAFEVLIGDVEEDSAIFRFGPLLEDGNRALVTLEQRWQ